MSGPYLPLKSPTLTPRENVEKIRKYFYWLIQLEIPRSGENLNTKSTTTFFFTYPFLWMEFKNEIDN